MRTLPQLSVSLGLLGMATVLMIVTGTAYNIYIFNSCLLAVIGASALNLLMGTVGLVSIGTAAFLLCGGFTAIFATRAGLPFAGAVVAAVLVSAMVGLIVGLPALRLRGVYLALSTLAAHFIILYIAKSYQSSAAGSGGFLLNPWFASRGLLGQQQLWAILLVVVAAIVLLLTAALTSGRLGRAWRMIRDNETVAAALGIPTVRYKLAAFVTSTALIGLQGALTAQFSSAMSVDGFTFLLAVQYIAMILVGGQDSILGSVLGAFVIVALPSLTSTLTGPLLGSSQSAVLNAQVSQILYGLIIIFFVTRNPDGLVKWLVAIPLTVRRWTNRSRTDVVAPS